MDDFSMEGEILRDALDKIARINQLLGGNKITLEGVKKLVTGHTKREITIVDIGCGNGDMLRALAVYGTQNNLTLKLIGIDANAFTIGYAEQLSFGVTNISYKCVDIFEENALPECDIILCTLTLHHFKDDEIISLLGTFKTHSNLGFVVNDLHRSRTAYYLFEALCFVFGLNYMSRKDGLVSILRGFKKKDLIAYSGRLGLNDYKLRWKWAFRYQWVVRMTKNVLKPMDQ